MWLFSSLTVWADNKSEVKPVKFQKILLSFNIEEDKFETLIYVTPLERLDLHRTRVLVIGPEQPSSFSETTVGFGESDTATLQFLFEYAAAHLKMQIKIDWEDARNKKPGYVAKLTVSAIDRGRTLPLITGTAVLQDGDLELK